MNRDLGESELNKGKCTRFLARPHGYNGCGGKMDICFHAKIATSKVGFWTIFYSPRKIFASNKLFKVFSLDFIAYWSRLKSRYLAWSKQDGGNKITRLLSSIGLSWTEIGAKHVPLYVDTDNLGFNFWKIPMDFRKVPAKLNFRKKALAIHPLWLFHPFML